MEWNDARKSLTDRDPPRIIPGNAARRTFNVVLVRKAHGVGDGETTQPDKIVRYSGKKVVVRF